MDPKLIMLTLMRDKTPITSKDFDDPFQAFVTLLAVVLRTAGYVLCLTLFSLVLVFGYFYFQSVAPLIEFESALLKVLFDASAVFLYGSLLFNYLQCIYVGPGYASKEFDEEYASLVGSEARSHCEICDIIKPPRAHHCKICDRCVLKMDHHCPWINNCVGFNNHRSFFLFVLYLGVCLSWFSLSMGYILYFVDDTPSTHSTIRITRALFPAMAVIGMTILGMAISQAIHIISNTTIIEKKIHQRYRKDLQMHKKDPEAFQLPQKPPDYNRGWKRNCYEFFGTTSYVAFFMPSIRPLKGDGIHFDVRKTDD